MDVLGARITGLLSKRGLPQRELAAAVGVHVNIVSCWCRSVRTPNIEQIAEIARFFNVSSDYLLGLTDVEENNLDYRMISEKTGLSPESVKNLMRLTNDEGGNFVASLDSLLSSWSGIYSLAGSMYGVLTECEQARDYLKEKASFSSGLARDYQTGKVIDRMELSFFKADEAFRDAVNKSFGYRQIIDDLKGL